METKIEYAIEESIGVLSEGKTGWTKELNLVSWNGRPAKYDVRDWGPEHKKLGKGITLTAEEAAALAALLTKRLGNAG
jgi:hypothetical protein